MPPRIPPSLVSKHLGEVVIEYEQGREYRHNYWAVNNSDEWSNTEWDTRPLKPQKWYGWPLCWKFVYRGHESNRQLIRKGLIDPKDPFQRGEKQWTETAVAEVPHKLFNEELPLDVEDRIPWFNREKRLAHVYPMIWRRTDHHQSHFIRVYNEPKWMPRWTVTALRARGVDSKATVEGISRHWKWITAEPSGRDWHETKCPEWNGVPLPPESVVAIKM